MLCVSANVFEENPQSSSVASKLSGSGLINQSAAAAAAAAVPQKKRFPVVG